jgi:hypothetical protein
VAFKPEISSSGGGQVKGLVRRNQLSRSAATSSPFVEQGARPSVLLVHDKGVMLAEIMAHCKPEIGSLIQPSASVEGAVQTPVE